MALKGELMAVGMPPSQANRLGFDASTAFTAAGTTQGTATVLSANNAVVTTSSIGAGVIVGAETKYCIYNAGPNVLSIYPAVGDGFLGLATNASIQVAAGNTCKIEGGGTAGATWVTAG